ncbi:MAG: FG-GAP-like repeat-containing protein [Acidobacteriota bacterium]
MRPAVSFRRRARLGLIAGGAGALLAAALVLLLRPAPAPYTPGADRGAGEAITRRLERDLPEDVPAVRFTEVAGQSGLRFRHFQGTRSVQLPEDMGSGAAWGDYDNDGDPDVFLVNESGPLSGEGGAVPGSAARSALYRNDGNGRFVDVTESSGLGLRGCGMGAAWGDYDGDGRLDLFVTAYGVNRLFRNGGDGTFTDVSAIVGVGGREGFWTGVSWADYDRDGDVDLYVCGYVGYRYDAALVRETSMQYQAVVPFSLNPSSYPPERNLLLRNEGGRFVEVAREAGVDNPGGRSLSAVWADFDGDGWLDLYVANDVSDNAMFRNRGDGSFEDVSHSSWVADYRGAMGLAVGDWDNDADLDILVTHWIAQENALYENQKGVITATDEEPMHFIDQADLRGLGQIALDYIGWGTGFIDYDNDGRLDLFVVNGSTFQREDEPALLAPMRDLLFWNGGADRGFFEVGALSGDVFAVEDVGRGAAFADYDHDGDVDILVTVNGGAARLLRNDGGNRQAWLRVILRGPPGHPGGRGPLATTTFASGALVTVGAGSITQMRVLGGGGSYLSQSPPGEVMFGLGLSRTVDRLEIRWPSGGRQTFRDLPASATVRIVEGGEPRIAGRAAADLTREAVVRFWKAMGRAKLERTRGECGRAVESYREALAIDPAHEEALYYLGQCLGEMGRFEDARRAFERLLRVSPESVRGHVGLASLLAAPEAPGIPDLAAAEEHLRRAHAINAEETGPMVRLGEILILRGDRDEAGRWLEAASRTNPRSVEAAFLAGYLRWEARDARGAREFYARAVAAARAERPVHGVPGEGDTRPGTGRAAVPGAGGGGGSAIGGSLFGAFCAGLGGSEAAPEGSGGSELDLDAIYLPVRRHVAALARRGSRAPGGLDRRAPSRGE